MVGSLDAPGFTLQFRYKGRQCLWVGPIVQQLQGHRQRFSVQWTIQQSRDVMEHYATLVARPGQARTRALSPLVYSQVALRR